MTTTPTMLTKELFDTHMNEIFRIALASGEALELRLVHSRVVEAGGVGSKERAPFAVIFSGGPADRFLPQRTYDVEHPVMGTHPIFLVPLGPEAGEMRYEAVFT